MANFQFFNIFVVRALIGPRQKELAFFLILREAAMKMGEGRQTFIIYVEVSLGNYGSDMIMLDA